MEAQSVRPEPGSAHAELLAARAQLAEQERRLELVLDAHETERQVLAHQLHDQAAQTLAAIQLGLRAVERELGVGEGGSQLAALRTQLADVVRTIREIAVRLRPPTLDQLGLEPALHGLADRVRADRSLPVTLQTGGIGGRMAPHLETAAYRVVDELFGAAEEPVHVRVDRDRARDSLRIKAGPFDSAASSTIVARIATRLDHTGDAITVYEQSTRTLHVRIPLARPS